MLLKLQLTPFSNASGTASWMAMLVHVWSRKLHLLDGFVLTFIVPRRLILMALVIRDFHLAPP